MNRFRDVIFDLDGTLVDSLPGISFSVDAALAECGLPPANRHLAPLLGPPVRQILATVAETADEAMLDRLERAFRFSYDAEGWRRTSYFPGVPDLLWGLFTDGADLWISTNKPSSPTARILRKLNLNGFFREVCSRDSRLPPFCSKAEIVKDLIARHRIPTPTCLMVGDTLEDRRAAEAAGIECFLVGPESRWEDLRARVRGEEVTV